MNHLEVTAPGFLVVLILINSTMILTCKSNINFFQGLLCLLLLSPTLISCDSQRGDWYDTYQGDGYSSDVPVEAQLTGAGIFPYFWTALRSSLN